MLFRSESLDETEAFLSSSYTPMTISGRPERTGARIERRAAGGLHVDRLAFDFTMSYDAGPLEKLCLITVDRGVHTSGGDVCGPGETFLVALPGRPYAGEVRAARYTITMFDAGLLDQATEGGERVRLSGQTALGAAENRMLCRTVAHVRDTLLQPGFADQPLLTGAAARLLAATTLSCLPHTRVDTAADRTGSRDGTSDTLRRAVAFIEENAHRDIGLAEIAAAVPVTPRAVQYAFSRYAATTPLGHLRRVRLARAHEELRAAAPALTTVTAVAVRWGFAHQGRFAAAYREAYGVTPGTTLRG
ncbi:helix-turn-helix transcriptional regulator [Streptomyces sp. NPDC054904]|uniref:helix-turn-helix transcriptional regulator n=1 Tax=unclassified Streptomyces TaxID=2593676 RepID=UPI002481C25A|nr:MULTISPECIES: AraC family transcriptional regulator [unclassified Streptomyces]MDA5284066.1 AraC family transcriptional regulator [Streptomyces sp. Isolate_45]MDX2395057.1 AraC family transcriptional regulator [Streptomyces sp. DK15]